MTFLKRGICICIVLSVLLTFSSCNFSENDMQNKSKHSFAPFKESKGTLGNSNGNMTNESRLAFYGDWIYHNGIRENIKTHEQQSTGAFFNINLYGGYLYYTSDQKYENNCIYRISLNDIENGNIEPDKLYEERVHVAKNLVIYNNWAYFINYYDDGYTLCKAKLDGSELIELYQMSGEYPLNIMDNNLYYIGCYKNGNEIQDDTLCKMDLENDKLTAIYHFSGGFQDIPSNGKTCFYNGKLYYSTVALGGIYEFDLETLHSKEISNADAASLNIYEDILYYCEYRSYGGHVMVSHNLITDEENIVAYQSSHLLNIIAEYALIGEDSLIKF